MEKFDVIVVGAGPAGATAGYLLAQAGLNVLIVERGQAPGQKNVSGGLIYSKSVSEFYPEFWKSAPIERAITGHQLVMLSKDASVGVDFRTTAAGEPPYNAFSVLRAQFDPWMAEQAEAAGAALIPGVTVDSLLMEEGRVIGIQAGPDQLGADVVVIAEGTKSMLLKQAGFREKFHPHDVSLGVKEVIALPEKVIEERFQCTPNTGAAYTLVGHTHGIEGGGFLYTNRASLSLGIVIKIDSLYESKLQPHQVLDEFKEHPLIQRLIADGEVVEYSAQTVHRGGFHLATQMYGDGFVVAGSAARLLLNNIMTLRGMDFAVVSGAAAAKAIIEANKKGSYSKADLAVYVEKLKETPIYHDWKLFKDTYPLLENKRLFDVYPELAAGVMEDLFAPSAEGASRLLASARKHMKGKVSMFELVKDAIQIGRGVV